MTLFHTLVAPLTPAAFSHAAATAVTIRDERRTDVPAREALLDVCFGANRARRTCHRMREGQRPAKGLAFSATLNGRVVGTVRLWDVEVGGVDALILGPLAVEPACRDLGVGGALMRHAIAQAKQLGHGAIVLLGDAPYYARFGFSAASAGLALPGPFERDRLLALELRAGALEHAAGMIAPAQRAAALPRQRRSARLAA